MNEPLQVVAKVATVLDALMVEYVVGGSVASSVYGIPRATLDVDIVADLQLSHVRAFVDALKSEFYVDADMIRDAIERRASFNVIHLQTMFKADIFIVTDDPWIREELRRARTESFGDSGAQVVLKFASPEDVLLHKLVGYRMADPVSDRQWNDVLGVLRVQGTILDLPYLQKWAAHLGVSDLLARARGEGLS